MKKRGSLIAGAMALAGCADVLGIKDVAFDAGTQAVDVVEAGSGLDATAHDATPADGGAEAPVVDSAASDAPVVDAASDAAVVTCTSADASTNCDGTCVDLSTDPYNCGVCGQTCTSTVCSNGYCVPQTMCDGTGNDAGAANTDNSARLAFETDDLPGGPYFRGYFTVDESVYECDLPTTAPSPAPAPDVVLKRTLGVFANSYGDVVNDSAFAYVFLTLSSDGKGNSLERVASTANVEGATYGTLVADVTRHSGIFTMSASVLDLVTFATNDAGATPSTSVSCIPVSGTLYDGAAGGGFAVTVDSTADIIRGATFSDAGCGTPVELATGVNAENAIAVAQNGQVFAFVNGPDLFVCPTTGCSASQASTPYAPGVGAIDWFGLAFDGSSPPNLYFVGTAGLARCSGVTPDGTCTPTVLVPGIAMTSGIGLDPNYVYYLEGMVLARVPK